MAKFHPGEDYRLLVFKDKVVATIKRLPPQIIGNGKSKIKQLISKENFKRKKFNQKAGIKAYKKIKIDSETQRQLKKNHFKLDSVLPKNQILVLRGVANCSAGGIAQTLAVKSFHPTIVQAAIKAAKAIGLTFASIDFILKDPKKPLEEENGVILETNSSPGLVPHHYPFIGQPQKIAPLIFKALLY